MSETPSAPSSDPATRLRKIWASGDYAKAAVSLLPISDQVIRISKARAAERVLDIACGTGNTALAARARGAIVTGLDITPELLEIARTRAVTDGYDDIAWNEGDAAHLPYPDASFDVVVSTCGLMFAPGHRNVASELARVTVPGGRIAIQAWTPDGGIGKRFAITDRYAPRPSGTPAPFDWGSEEKVRALLDGAFTGLTFEHSDLPSIAPSPEVLADTMLEIYPPLATMRLSLSPELRASLRTDLIHFYRGYVTHADGKVRAGREYLITTGTRV